MSTAAAPTDAERAALAGLERALGEAASTLAPIQGAPASPAAQHGAPARSARLLLDLIEAAERIEALAERRYGVEDWRSVACVDADSILEERRLWAEVHRHGSRTRGR